MTCETSIGSDGEGEDCSKVLLLPFETAVQTFDSQAIASGEFGDGGTSNVFTSRASIRFSRYCLAFGIRHGFGNRL